MSETSCGAIDAAIPALARRMASFTYEGLLLFAVAVITGLIYSPIVDQRHALTHRHGLMLALFVSFGAYFIYFWTKSGQTLPMKTWHIRLLDRRGEPVDLPRALGRYLLSYLWFAPALLSLYAFDSLDSGWLVTGVMLFGIIAYATLARLLPQRQFLHDVLCGTRLITQRPVKH